MTNKPLTEAQRQTIKNLSPSEIFSQHLNGDVTILAKKGYSQHRIRINPLGVIVQRTARSGASKDSYQPSLSNELTEGLKSPIQKKPEALRDAKFAEAKKDMKAAGLTPKAKPTPAYSASKVTYDTTICQERPECCKPRAIKHVALDADHTIWHMPVTAAAVTGPLKKLDDNTVVELNSSGVGKPTYKYLTEEDLAPEERALLVGLDIWEKDYLLEELTKEHYSEFQPAGESHRTTIKLDPTFRPLLDELDKRNIPVSIISLNTPGSVKRILKEFGLDKRFVEIRDSYENKGKVFKDITHKTGVCPCDAIFVDDNRTNVQDVAEKCGVGLQIGQGKDIEQIIDLLKFIKD